MRLTLFAPASVQSLMHRASNIRNITLIAKGNDFLINLVEYGTDLDLSSAEVNGTLRVVDGTLIVLDGAGFIPLEIEQSLRLALRDRVKPILVIDNIHRLLFHAGLDQESIYRCLSRTVEAFNAIVFAHQGGAGPDDWQVCPGKGTVIFASSLQGWGFTLQQFAERNQSSSDIDLKAATPGLWSNDQYWDPKGQTLGTSSISTEREVLSRAFNVFILDPIMKFHDAVARRDNAAVASLLQKLGMRQLDEDDQRQYSRLFEARMKHHLPFEKAILDTATMHLPSPIAAQKYRAEVLYEGPMQDEAAIATKSCDAGGPLVLFVARAVRGSDKGKWYAFGRVFAGTAKPGESIRIQGRDSAPGTRWGVSSATAIGEILSVAGREIHPVAEVISGNLLALTLMDREVFESCTLTTASHARSIRHTEASRLSHPLVQVSIEVDSLDLPRLAEGLKQLSILQPSCQTWVSEIGDYMIGGNTERHIRLCVKDLMDILDGMDLIVSKPFVSYRETIKDKSTVVALSKTGNRHNRLFCKASPMGELTDAIEADIVKPLDDFKARAQTLVDDYGWNVADARKIWCFGPEGRGANILVDATKDARYIHEIKDALITGFQWATKEGVTCEEQMRGVRLSIVDVTLAGDAIHRGSGQIIPAARRVTYAACMLGTPALQEPIYRVELRCPSNYAYIAISCLQRRDGQIISQHQRLTGQDTVIRGYLPISQSFGFDAELSSCTGANASICSVFNHWETLPGCPLDKGSVVEELAIEIRKRKGLKPEVPPLEFFCDRL